MWILFPNAPPVPFSPSLPISQSKWPPLLTSLLSNGLLTAFSPYAVLWSHQSVPIEPCLSGASHCCGDNFQNLYLDLQALQNLAPTHSLTLFLSNVTIHIPTFPTFCQILQCSILLPAFRLSLLFNAFPHLWYIQPNNHLLTKVHFAIHLVRSNTCIIIYQSAL